MPPPPLNCFNNFFSDCYYFMLSFLDLDGNLGYCLNLCCTIKMHKNAYHSLDTKSKNFLGNRLNEVKSLTQLLLFTRSCAFDCPVTILVEIFISPFISCKKVLSAFLSQCTEKQGRNHASKVGVGPNRAKPESRAASARESRAKPEKERGVWGRGSVSSSPDFGILNYVILYTVEQNK